ncbi:hypothetical protein KUTeg_009803 [Tegillarca granosa]|uniref:Uncharacterized protein n=1 Tax=Tegillarca granosa TaxID=220873 RepID=A0ABQ9F823_TEGGR|nr:hypothetical protein KUTeg_009803 [Tegillarca granosa]
MSGIDEAKRKEAHKFLGDDSKMSYEISNSGDNWTFKAVFSMDGDKLVEKQVGDGFTTENVRTASGDEMSMLK